MIVPAYNVEPFVAQAVESALAQTYPAVEVVVIDDGSTDGTAAALAPFGDRIVFVRQENRGLAGARNSGIRAARGELLAWLDADDWWAPGRLATCAACLAREPGIDAVTTDAFLVEGDRVTDRRFYGAFNPLEFPRPAEQLAEIARRNFVFVSAVVRRSLLDRTGLFDERLRRAEDYDLWIRALLAGARIELLREPLAYYRVRPDSLSADAPAQWAAHLRVLEHHVGALGRQRVYADPGVYYEIARSLARRGRRRRALEVLRLAARAPGLPRGQRRRALAGGVRDVLLGARAAEPAAAQR